jgi:SAM-dependent methyltransferase
MDVVGAARQIWRDRVPATVRARVNAVRAARREAQWRKPRDLGDLRRTAPFSTWGEARGGPIDRYYIELFLTAHASDIRGRVLEIAGDEYVRKYGAGVERADILDIEPENPNATFIADLGDAPNVPDDSFDCVLVTQLLPFVYDFKAALRTTHRVLLPGGVLLVTTPGICRLAPIESESYGHWWSFTSMSAKRVCEELYGTGNVEVQTFGNVLSAAGFLFGLGPFDLSQEELDLHDPAFEVTIGVRAVKSA